MAVQTLDKDCPQTAWAIFLLDEDTGTYVFHSAHWSKARAKEMLWHEWERPKIVKIAFTVLKA